MKWQEFIEKHRDNLTPEERERQWAEKAAFLQANEAPLVEALTAMGWPKGVRQCNEKGRSVWDLVNTAEPYPHLISTLVDHVTRPYHKRIKEGIVRALAVDEARGTRAPRVLMDELRKVTGSSADSNSYRWVLINSLLTIGDASLADEVQQLVADPRYEAVREDLIRLHSRIRKRRPPRSDGAL